MTRAVLVTGASGGIGAATARLAARDGWDVGIGWNSDHEGAERTKAEVEALGRKAVLLQGDLSDPEAIARVFGACDAAFPRLDALVNNAGVVDRPIRVDQVDLARLRRMFDINTIGPILCSREAVLRMSTRHGGAGGVIVNVSSVAARIGSANEYVDYAAAKAAIDTFSKGLADEVAREGIRVVALRPGLTDTAIHGKGGQPGRAERLADRVPMGRVGTPEDIAEGIVWLISDAARYVTGTTLDISGGR
ncbi:SDR family oxidoreductase [Silicimonas algicola]|uniref:Glucose 1-dehydrogenase n=1 Tax=Silicimonas algicola TaxID=1826607 RepID=A0A316G348_9RHOB|nr:SDR family oxidoreductase [Silicimonas algicola]AZQ66853.1 SDR family oxidoreductase [Silicimonas algicola]PWK55238.1 glucose 1-dehydrogenase [Silicimonas algicola]